jgi:hypothetical protein
MAENVLNTNECSWKSISINILGRKIVGLRGFEYAVEQEKEYLYGQGDDPIDILAGNSKYEGNFKLLKYEVDLMNDAAIAAGYSSIVKVPHQLISAVIQYRKSNVGKIRTVNVAGIAFKDAKIAMEQNAKFTEVTLSFMAMKITEVEV